MINEPKRPLQSLTMFFPFHNEEDNIVFVIESAVKTGLQIADDLEIIAIDDGSDDSTAKLARSMEKKYPELVRTIIHKHNLGYGAALKTGFVNSTKDWFFFSDGDRLFKMEDLHLLVDIVVSSDQPVVAVGYRMNRKDPLYRRLNAALFNILIRVSLGLRKVRDIDCAFKLIPGDALKRVFPLSSDGAIISAELLCRCKKAGYSILEVPIPHYPRIEGTQSGARISVIVKAFMELARNWKRFNTL